MPSARKPQRRDRPAVPALSILAAIIAIAGFLGAQYLWLQSGASFDEMLADPGVILAVGLSLASAAVSMMIAAVGAARREGWYSLIACLAGPILVVAFFLAPGFRLH